MADAQTLVTQYLETFNETDPDRRREQWEAEIKAVGNAIGYSGPISILNTDTMINWFKWTTTYIEFRLVGDKLGLWLQEWHDESKKECPVTTTESMNHKYIGAGTVDDVATTGTTLRAAASALRAAGTGWIAAVTAARTPPLR